MAVNILSLQNNKAVSKNQEKKQVEEDTWMLMSPRT